MLWYKSWLDTRWQFLAGLAVMTCSAIATVLVYPDVQRLLPAMTFDPATDAGRSLQEAALLAGEYRGYIWWEWFNSNLRNLAIFFAVLIGSAGSLTPAKGALFTLSLPVSRDRVVNAHAMVGLGEIFVLALVPSMVISLLSPVVGQSYGAVSALVHALCSAIVVAVFFMLAAWLSSAVDDFWPPLVISLAVAYGLSVFDRSVSRILSAESYFQRGQLPWIGLVASGTAIVAMHFAARRALARRDF